MRVRFAGFRVRSRSGSGEDAFAFAGIRFEDAFAKKPGFALELRPRGYPRAYRREDVTHARLSLMRRHPFVHRLRQSRARRRGEEIHAGEMLTPPKRSLAAASVGVPSEPAPSERVRGVRRLLPVVVREEIDEEIRVEGRARLARDDA